MIALAGLVVVAQKANGIDNANKWKPVVVVRPRAGRGTRHIAVVNRSNVPRVCLSS